MSRAELALEAVTAELVIVTFDGVTAVDMLALAMLLFMGLKDDVEIIFGCPGTEDESSSDIPVSVWPREVKNCPDRLSDKLEDDPCGAVVEVLACRLDISDTFDSAVEICVVVFDWGVIFLAADVGVIKEGSLFGSELGENEVLPLPNLGDDAELA